MTPAGPAQNACPLHNSNGLVIGAVEMMADIPALSEHSLNKFAEEHGKPVKRLSAPALDLLKQYPWPGNVRELENIIERAVLVCDEDTILSVHLPPTLQRQEAGGDRRGLSAQVENLERQLITEALRQTRGNQSHAAQILDTSPADPGLQNQTIRHRGQTVPAA